MAEFEAVKTSDGKLRGFTQQDEEARVKFKKFVDELEAGEFFRLTYKRERNPKFHRKLFAMLKLAFDAWEPEKGRKRLTYKGAPIEKDFDQFRRDMLIRAGFYVAKYDAKGRVMLEAQSISFANMDDERFAEVYEAVLKVCLTDILTNYTRADADRVIEEMQRF